MDTKMLTKLLLLFLGTAVIHFSMAIGFLWQENIADKRLDQTKKMLAEEWKDEDSIREEEQEAELQAKYGTNKFDRIAYDPRMDIALVIQKMFESVMPPEYLVSISVDRFTEFKVFINVFNMPETDILARYLREVFSRIEPKYVHEIVITDEDHYWIIGTRQLLKVGDWNKAGVSTIGRYCFR